MNKRLLIISLSFFLSFKAFAIDFWQYPEAADSGSVFAGVFAASLAFSSPSIEGMGFSFFLPELSLDCVLPIGLPFSLGVSFRAFEGGYFSFSLRPAYHINLDIEWLNFYIIYPLSFSASEGELDFQYCPALGIRARIAGPLSFSAEIGPPPKGLALGASLKLN